MARLSLWHMMHALAVAPVSDITVRSDLVYDHHLPGLAKGNREQDFEVVRYVQVLTESLPVYRTDYAAIRICSRSQSRPAGFSDSLLVLRPRG